MQCLDIKKRIRRNESGRKLEISCNMIKKWLWTLYCTDLMIRIIYMYCLLGIKLHTKDAVLACGIDIGLKELNL